LTRVDLTVRQYPSYPSLIVLL